jgi:CubicO group peptidase (beta-lactamase class C family)
MRIARYSLVVLVGLALWATLVVTGTLNGVWKTALAPAGDAVEFVDAVRDRIARNNRGSIAFRLIENGQIHDYFASTAAPVDSGSVFQVASLSKWVSAWGVMKLVESGRLDLDAPVSTYLTRWSLPESEFDNSAVTVRRLLSHTAGLTDGLGYNGFRARDDVQTLEASLTQATDIEPGTDGRTRVGIEPGTQWRYSGGGYTLLQLVVEEVTGEAFAHFMAREIFEPLGMQSSTFVLEPGAPRLATLYDGHGNAVPYRTYTALAAASLHTSVDDLTRFVAAHLPGPAGEPVGRGVLSADTLALMRTPTASRYGAAIWGLGTILYAPNGQGNFVIGHDGASAPAINSAARLDPSSGDAIVVLASGNSGLATTIAGEWTFWKSGVLDVLAFTQVAPTMVAVVAAGWLVIVLGALFVAWHRGRSRPLVAPTAVR